MNTAEYLERLKAGLSGFSEEEQAVLLEEIAGHIADGNNDPQLGPEGEARQARLFQVMGSPEDLSRGLRNVHRPKRWLDYVLVVGPNLLVFSWVGWIISVIITQPVTNAWWGAPGLYFGIRAIVAMQAALIYVGLRRGSTSLLAYWLPEAILTIFTICLRENRWEPASLPNSTFTGTLESLFWLLLLAAALFGPLWLLWRNRDPLLLVVATIPFLITAGNMVSSQLIERGWFPDGYNFPRWILLGHFGPNQVAEVVWPALFYLPRQRALRWLGLLAYAAPFAIMNQVAAARYPALAIFWSLPILLVLAAWLFEISQNRKRLAPFDNYQVEEQIYTHKK